MKNKTVFDNHQIRIAKATLRLTDAAVGVLGGPDKIEAREILRKFGYSEEKIAILEK